MTKLRCLLCGGSPFPTFDIKWELPLDLLSLIILTPSDDAMKHAKPKP